jgi:UDP-N-acetylmuramyl pentapeptide phosphotransferase/UDP-N-acetylglucosamine-1-phosphate transferase
VVPDFPLPFAALVAVAAAVLTYGGLAAAIGWLRKRALAKPNQRSSHTVPTPQGAGLVIVPAALLSGAIALAAGAPLATVHVAAVYAAALALTVIGFADDMRGLSVTLRLTAQVIAVTLAILSLPADIRVFPGAIPLPAERIVLIGAALWFVNLFNFMDGIDLISVVETVAITLGVALLAMFGALPAVYAYVALALLGAMVGFAPWNAPPARLFLGDAGSLPVGLMLGVLLVHVAAAGLVAAALILPLYYLADATITLLRRLARGERVWEAHRQHFYQQATRNGLSVTGTVGRIAVLNAVLIALAVGSSLHGPLWAGVAFLLACAAVGLTLRTLARGGGG